MKSKIKTRLLLTLIILSGFGREYIKININWIKKYLTEGGANYSQDIFKSLLNWDLQEIEDLKWGLTILFTIYFFLLTFYLLKFLFPKNGQYQRITVITYVMIVLTSALIYLFGLITGTVNNLYTSVRTLMGLGQSFIPLMILYLLFKFTPKLK